VRDQGKGLSREEVQQVFLPFYRTEEAKVQRIEGVGLGLAVTRSLVEMHRGKIWAAPRGEVRGGCFIFTLPTL
jgi:signal transduction histidine kinase